MKMEKNGPKDYNSAGKSGYGMSYKHTYRPFFLEYALLAELNLVRRQKPGGVFVVPSSASALIWFGIIFVRQGHYEGGAFKFTLYIPDTFPDCDCPTVIFESPPFHPMISATTGEFDSKKSFPKWRKGTHHLWQLLLCIRRSFFQFDSSDPFNPEAASLFDKDPNLFNHKAGESVKTANSHIFDAPASCDQHALVFHQISQEQFESLKEDMKKVTSQQEDSRRESSGGGNKTPGSGLSWVMPGTSDVFSKECSPFASDQS